MASMPMIRSFCWRSRVCSIPLALPPANTPPGPTATCPMVPPSTCRENLKIRLNALRRDSATVCSRAGYSLPLTSNAWMPIW